MTTTESKIGSLRDGLFSIEMGDSYGVYIPQYFCRDLRPEVIAAQDEATREAIAECAAEDSQDGEFYWEAWDDVLNGFEYEGKRLHQNGDLWAYDVGILEQLQELLDEEELDGLWM